MPSSIWALVPVHTHLTKLNSFISNLPKNILQKAKQPRTFRWVSSSLLANADLDEQWEIIEEQMKAYISRQKFAILVNFDLS